VREGDDQAHEAGLNLTTPMSLTIIKQKGEHTTRKRSLRCKGEVAEGAEGGKEKVFIRLGKLIGRGQLGKCGESGRGFGLGKRKGREPQKKGNEKEDRGENLLTETAPPDKETKVASFLETRAKIPDRGSKEGGSVQTKLLC